MVALNSYNLSLSKEPNLLSITFSDLINLKACIGVSRELWNPNSRFFVTGFRNNYSVIDLRFIYLSLRRAVLFLRNSLRYRAHILSIANPKFYSVFEDTARERGMTIVNGWIPGFLTNYKNVYWHYDERGSQSAHLFDYPDVSILFELDRKHDFIRNESRRLSLPLLSFVDSDMDFSKSVYGIIGNNDSFSFLKLCFRVVITLIDLESDYSCIHFYKSQRVFSKRVLEIIRLCRLKFLKSLDKSKFRAFNLISRYADSLFYKKTNILKRLLTIGFEPIPIDYRSDFKSDASTKFRQVSLLCKGKSPKFKEVVWNFFKNNRFAKANHIQFSLLESGELKNPSFFYYNRKQFDKFSLSEKYYFLRRKIGITNPILESVIGLYDANTAYFKMQKEG